MTILEFDDERLPYPTIKHRTRWPGCHLSEEYLIPEEDMPKVFTLLYPYAVPPAFDTRMIDVHEEQDFVLHSFKVVREAGMNMLVSPYSYRSGGSVIDWMPAKQSASVDPRGPGEYSIIGFKGAVVAQRVKPGCKSRLEGLMHRQHEGPGL